MSYWLKLTTLVRPEVDTRFREELVGQVLIVVDTACLASKRGWSFVEKSEQRTISTPKLDELKLAINARLNSGLFSDIEVCFDDGAVVPIQIIDWRVSSKRLVPMTEKDKSRLFNFGLF